MTSNQFLSGTVSTDAAGQYVSAIIPTIGFGGMVLTTGGWPLAAGTRFRVLIQWFSDPAGANELASKQFVSACVTTGAGGIAYPHAGDYVRVTIQRSLAAAISFTINAEHRDTPLCFWIPQQASPENMRQTYLVQFQSVSVNAGTTTTLNSFNAAYEGPAQLVVNNFVAAAANDWVVNVFSEDEAGVRNAVIVLPALVGHQAENMSILVPPGYLTIDLRNNTAAVKGMSVGLVGDWSRMAA